MKLHPRAREPYVVFDGLATTPRLDHAECVVVAPDGTLWCGGEAGQIFRISGTDITEVAGTNGFTLGLALDGDVLYVCDVLLPGIWRLDTTSGALSTFGTTVAGHDLLNPNYPVVLPDGSLLVSDSGRANTPHTGLVHFDVDGKGSVWLDEPFEFANGLALTRDGRTLYIAESWAHRVRAVDVDEYGRPLGPVRTHANTPGYLIDGLAHQDGRPADSAPRNAPDWRQPHRGRGRCRAGSPHCRAPAEPPRSNP